ncbi:actin cytoskeleton-regulatory complex protein PAN1 [Notolabrus celidotus]|uniref:actin cytoskeleton-regulatory complex protein PAN1 n=1 Tax=Notolabrus celidotus TaxID=1203425 RepID=UPI00148FE87D|nr:actin cytoskeleton-regulatory complex protein PAN1 [Notolabrus celidotus]
MMSWDRQLSSLLSVADSSVAKMRERLSSPGEDLFPVRERIDAPPPPPPRPLPHRERPLPVSVQWSDLATLQSQLQIQRQEIQSLTHRVITMESERHSQHSHIQNLQEEVQRLRNRGAEEWRREAEELSSLREQFTRATSIGHLEESLSSKLEYLRRDMELLKTQLRRQGEELLHLQEETRESRRRDQHTCRTVEQMTDSFRSLSSELTKNVSDTRQEVQQIRSNVSQLKEELRTTREHRLSAHTPGASPLLPLPHRGLTPDPDLDSDSEDFSPTPSLAEVSSDDLSWLEHRDPPDRRRRRRVSLSDQSDLSAADEQLQDDDDDDGDDDDLLDDV